MKRDTMRMRRLRLLWRGVHPDNLELAQRVADLAGSRTGAGIPASRTALGRCTRLLRHPAPEGLVLVIPMADREEPFWATAEDAAGVLLAEGGIAMPTKGAMT